MKKLVLFALALFCMISCSQTPENKVSSLIRANIEKSLAHPDSYEAIETVVDSAFAPKDDPAFYDKALALCNLFAVVEACRSEADRAERVMNIWENPYLDGLGQINYKQSKKKFEKYSEQVKYYTSKIEQEKDYLQEIINAHPRFIGFKVTHKFRAKTNSGDVLIGEKIFITNEEMTEILAGYDSDKEEYMLVQRIYQTIQETRQQWDENTPLEMEKFEDELNRCRDNL